MSSLDKVVIALDTSLERDQLKVFSGMDFLKNCDVTLVHLVQEVDYSDGISFNVAFPTDEDKSKLTDAVIEKMKQLSLEILPPGHLGSIDYVCLFAENIKDAFCQYLAETKVRLAVVASFHRHSVFDVSFGDYLSKKAPCGVLVIKGKGTNVKSVAVGVKLTEEGDVASEIAKYEFLRTANITLLHISRFSEFGLFSELDLYPYPRDEGKLLVEQEVLKRLDKIKAGLVGNGFTGEVLTVCEFSDHPKKHFLSYMEKNQIGFALLFRGRPGSIIRGSFAQHLLHQGDASTLVSKLHDTEPRDQHFHPSYLNRLQRRSDIMKHS